MTDKTAPSTPRQLAARLVHDVGKYVARTARNLPESAEPAEPIDRTLHAMLIEDLYGDVARRQPRPSHHFSSLAAPFVESLPRLVEVRALFATLDVLEDAVRAGEPAALRRATRIARDIEAALRALVHDSGAREPAKARRKGAP